MNGFFESSDNVFVDGGFVRKAAPLDPPRAVSSFPTTQEKIYRPVFDMEIPGWRTVSSVSGWKLSIRSSWDVLGPFPQHAREQHFLSPSFPFRSMFVCAGQTVCPDALGIKARIVSKSKMMLASHHLLRMVDLLRGPTRRPTTRGS